MRVHILCCRQSALTAVELASRIGNVSVSKEIPNDAEYVINWGCSDRYVHERTARTDINWLNKPMSCTGTIDKLTSLITMKHHGVPVPATYPMPKDEYVYFGIYNPDNTTKYVARTRTHMDGSGFFLVEGMEEMQMAMDGGCEFLMDFIPSCKEYRVHVFDGLIIRTQYKHHPDPEGADDTCRITDNGWVLRHMHVVDVPMYIRQAAKDAVRALSLNFGAVDVLHGTDNKPYVLEVNTAPFLTDITLSGYVSAIKQGMATRGVIL